jgi:hypothetical protein
VFKEGFAPVERQFQVVEPHPTQVNITMVKSTVRFYKTGKENVAPTISTSTVATNPNGDSSIDDKLDREVGSNDGEGFIPVGTKAPAKTENPPNSKKTIIFPDSDNPSLESRSNFGDGFDNTSNKVHSRNE